MEDLVRVNMSKSAGLSGTKQLYGPGQAILVPASLAKALNLKEVDEEGVNVEDKNILSRAVSSMQNVVTSLQEAVSEVVTTDPTNDASVVTTSESVDLDSMSIAQLDTMAKERGVEVIPTGFNGKPRKKDYIEALS